MRKGKESVEFCPNCDEETVHIEVPDDDVFDYAKECTQCNVVFEYEPYDKDEDE